MKPPRIPCARAVVCDDLVWPPVVTSLGALGGLEYFDVVARVSVNVHVLTDEDPLELGEADSGEYASDTGLELYEFSYVELADSLAFLDIASPQLIDLDVVFLVLSCLQPTPIIAQLLDLAAFRVVTTSSYEPSSFPLYLQPHRLEIVALLFHFFQFRLDRIIFIDFGGLCIRRLRLIGLSLPSLTSRNHEVAEASLELVHDLHLHQGISLLYFCYLGVCQLRVDDPRDELVLVPFQGDRLAQVVYKERRYLQVI